MKLTVKQLRRIIKEEVSKVIVEATREPDNMVKDLKSLPIGGRITRIRLGDIGDRYAFVEKRLVGRQRKYVLVRLDKNENPKSEEVFDSAEKLAHSIGRFAY